MTQAALDPLRMLADLKQEIDNLELALEQEGDKSSSASRPNADGRRTNRDGNDQIRPDSKPDPSAQPTAGTNKESSFDTASTGTEKESAQPFDPASTKKDSANHLTTPGG